MKKCILFVIVFTLFCIPVLLHAQDKLSGYDFLRSDACARAAGMGGAFVAVSNDLNALFYNPAGLAATTGRSASATYVDHVLDFNSGSVSYIHPARGKTTFAAGVYYQDYGQFHGRDESGNDTGNFSANEFFVQLGAGYRYRQNILLGISGKYFASNIESYSSAGLALDAGILFILKKDVTNIGLAIANAGTVSSAYIETKDPLPTVIKGGLSHRLAHLPLMLSLEGRYFTYGEFHFVGGGEFAFSPSLTGRFGYNSNRNDMKLGFDSDRLSGFSFGLGFNWRKYSIDYAYSSLGSIGSQNRVTISGNF